MKFEVYGKGEKVEDELGELVSIGEVLLLEAEGTVTPFTKKDVNADGHAVPSELTQVFLSYSPTVYAKATKIRIEGKDYDVENRRRFKLKMAFYITGYR